MEIITDEFNGLDQRKQIDIDLLKMQNEGIEVWKIDRRGRLRKIQLRLINGGRSISWASKVLGPKLGSRNKGMSFIYFMLGYFLSKIFISYS